MLTKGAHAAPAFADVDGDGDFDMLLGVNNPNYDPPGGPTEFDYSPTFFFRNTGTPTNPIFTEQTGASNPFDGIYGTKYGQSIPTFVNIDGDSDVDLFIGSSYASDIYGGHPAIGYYQNIAGAFTPTPHPLNNITEEFYGASLAFADIDEDGDLDALIGTYSPLFDFQVFCYINDDGAFVRSEGEWDPITHTGNPLYGVMDHNHISILTADFDGDGDLDVLVTQGDISSYEVENSNLKYFENSDGDFTLLDRTDLNVSPFGGVDVGNEAAPVFVDLDMDGDLDAVIGSKYSDTDLRVYINDDGAFTADPDHQLTHILDSFDFLSDVIPVFVDIDDDGDQDLFICANYYIHFFKNTSGIFENEYTPIYAPYGSYFREVSLAFIDVDSDGDFDAFVGNQDADPPAVQYYENVGTPHAPEFELTTAPSPFDTRDFEGASIFEEDPNVVSVDFNNDNDVDIVVSVSARYSDESIQTQVIFFENNGNGTFTELLDEPVFVRIDEQGYYNFFDQDGDGDLDAFAGTNYGWVEYLENTNPPPLTNVTVLPLNVVGGQPIQVDPTLTISDPDNDDIAQAYVTIENFVVDQEELGFTPQDGIEGVFDTQTGILTLIGKASIDTYQTLLRSVTFNYTGTVPSARKSSASGVLDLTQSIIFEVRDTDFTLTTVSVVSLNIVPGATAAELDIYNAMSPNSEDNFNPFFKIEHIETVSPENEVTIYNRWGDVVFDVKNYNNSEPSKRFEGVNKNGKDLPSGTYFYKIEISGKTLTGYLSLKR